MKQLKKKQIIKLAEEAGVLFNHTTPYNFPHQPHVVDNLYSFYLKILEEQQKHIGISVEGDTSEG